MGQSLPQSPQSCERMNFCCLSHSVCGPLLQEPWKQISRLSFIFCHPSLENKLQKKRYLSFC